MRAFLFTLLLVVPAFAQADVYFKPGVMFMQDKSLDGGTVGEQETTDTRTFINVSILFSVLNEWVLGGLYDSETTKSETGTTSTEMKRTNVGVSGGWVSAKDFGAFALVNYYASCAMTIGAINFVGNLCYQVDLGLKASVRSTGFGAQLSYRKFTYNKRDAVALEPPRENTGITPFFTVFLKF